MKETTPLSKMIHFINLLEMSGGPNLKMKIAIHCMSRVTNLRRYLAIKTLRRKLYSEITVRLNIRLTLVSYLSPTLHFHPLAVTNY